MNDTFEVFAPEALRRMLQAFSFRAAKKGDNYFLQGRVGSIEPREGGREFDIAVQGDDLYTVSLWYDDSAREWTNDCSCPVGSFCKHAYAATKALLAEQSASAVDKLSAGKKPVAEESDFPLGRLLSEKVGRPLNGLEKKFFHTLHRVYLRCRQRGYATVQDLEELGLHLGFPFWQTPLLWPEFPENEHLFWLFVARAAKEQRRPIHDFMMPITDLKKVERVVEAWRREEEIKQWRRQLATVKITRPPAPVLPAEGYDFRLAFFEEHAQLQWKRPGKDQFDFAKISALREIVRLGGAALANLPIEAQVIWQTFASRLTGYSASMELNYFRDDDVVMLMNLLASPGLASRMVNSEGRPLRRVSEPLRWQLVEPDVADANYLLRVAQADGSPLPRVLFIARGQANIYVTDDAIFTGPPPAEPLLDASEDNAIPIGALETEEGVNLLTQLGIPLPARMQERIRRVAVEPAIRCALDSSSGKELCIVHARAVSSDNTVEFGWTGSTWDVIRDKRKPGRSDEAIKFYDHSLMEQSVEHLAKLSPRQHPDAKPAAAIRVTKSFPEMFTNWLWTLPPEVTVELDPELASLAQDAVSGKVNLEVSEAEIDWFDLRVVLNVSDTTLTADEIKLLLNARGGFVRLKGKGWKRLKFDLTTEDEEQLARIGLTARELSAEPQRLHALQLAEPAAKRFLPVHHVEQIERRAGELKARVAPEVPVGVRAELRPYQRDGFHFLAYLAENNFGGILADDMGLGKTVQALTWLTWLHDNWRRSETKPPLPSLVVCPKSVMDNWQAEAAKFAPGIRVRIWSPDELREFINQTATADLHVINYAQLRILGESLEPVRWLAAILDEGQYIKNPSSQTAQSARALHARHRLILSGTPIENRLLDLWSLMSFAMPGVLGSRAQFAKLYDAKGDPFARRRLSARVRPFLIRRTKSQVAKDLPDRIEEDLFCEIEGEQRQLYRAEIKLAQQMLLKIKTQQELAKHQFHFLTSLLRLRQICCHPQLLKPDSAAPSAKLEALLEQVEPLMEEGQKVLVFSQFVQMLNLIRPVIEERGWPIFYLSGETENRGALVEKFQTSEGPGVFLISLKAGGFGLNLTAASYVVLFDPWWNPAVENQAIDRTHRIGQSNKVIAYRLLIKNSIEEKIRQLQKQKSALAQDVLGEEKFAQSLTLDDLRYLLAD
jgi:SNF2 family DNA or RNA helicase